MHADGELVETADGRIYVEREGAGEPVVIAPGGPGVGHAHYHPWFSALADRFEVVYFDYLGTGRSDRLDDPSRYTIERYAAGIEALRSHLGAERIALIGVSFGGMPALAYALAHADRVRRLVLSNAQISAATWQEGNIDAVNAALRDQFPERWESLLELRAEGIRSLDDRYQELFDGLLDDLEWEVTGTMAAFDPLPGLRDLRIPTLVATGRWDRLTTPRLTRRTVEALPDGVAELAIFERSAHRPWAEEPAAYFARVGAFLGAA
jgi:proline iminopeptidase